MSQTPERSNPIEQPAELVSRFIDFTRNLFEEGEHPFSYSLWETEMDRLWGNEELIIVTRDESFKGAPQVREAMVLALEEGGLNRMKGEFLAQALEHTQIANIRGIGVVIEQIVTFR